MDDCQMLTSVSRITPACTNITELLCQQVFIYNEEAHCPSHTSCAQTLQLSQSHICGNGAMIIYVIPTHLGVCMCCVAKMKRIFVFF